MSGLRSAVVWCLTLSHAPFSARDLADMSDSDQRAAKCYCTQLINERVLEVVSEDDKGLKHYRPGPKAEEWAAKTPKTNPHGNSRRYRKQQAVRDRLVADDWHMGRGGKAGELLHDKTRHRQTITPQDLKAQPELLEAYAGDQLLTVATVAVLADASTRTVERWIYKGHLKHIRMPTGSIRVPLRAWRELLAKVGGQS